jgi:hypothetical protein
MSIQEMKSRIHQLVDQAEDEVVLREVSLILSGEADGNPFNDLTDEQLATLNDLTDAQRERLEQSLNDHKDGRTVSHEDMKQRHGQWLNK